MWRYLHRDIQEHRCHTLSFVKCMISVVSALESPHFCFGNDKINLSRDRRVFANGICWRVYQAAEQRGVFSDSLPDLVIIHFITSIQFILTCIITAAVLQ